jgi:hypothetical protein
LPDSAAAEQALADLQGARDAGRLALGRDPAAIDESAALRRYGAPGELLAGARATVAAIGEALRADGYPALAAVVTARPAGPQGEQPPLLVTAFGWFFQRQVETDPELARGLHFEHLQQLSRTQAQGFAGLEQALADVGSDLNSLLGGIAAVHE